MSSAAQPSGFELAVAEGLLSALHDSPLALDTARKLLEDDRLTLEAAERELRAIVEAPRPCPTCGDVRALQEGACPNCGRVAEADAAADYPQRQPARKRKRKRRGRKDELLDQLVEATVINNTAAGSIVPTRPAPNTIPLTPPTTPNLGVPWGGANPAAATATATLEDLPGVTTPPNLRKADGWEACANCVFYFKACNLYGAGRPRADLVHTGGYPVERDDLCDSHASLMPREQRLQEARAELAEARRAGDNERVVRLRARVSALEENIFNKLLHPRAPKGRVGGGEFVEKVAGLKVGESTKVGRATVRRKHSRGPVSGRPHDYYAVEGPGLEKGTIRRHPRHTARTPEAAVRLAGRATPPVPERRTVPPEPGNEGFHSKLVSELTQLDERQRAKGKGWNPNFLGIAFGAVQDVVDPAMAGGASPEDAFADAFIPSREMHGVAKKLGLALDVDRGRWVKRKLSEAELEEVSSRVYPGLERSPRENWVERAGGLPSYIERIAKHLHYEKGMTISHAIATAVNTVKKWCAGAVVSSTGGVQKGGNVSAATKAKACKAVAQWEAKKARSKVSEALAELEREARADGAWRYPSLEEAAALLEEAEVFVDAYPPLGSGESLPRYVNRVAGHLRSRGKTVGEAIAIAATTARAVGDGEAGPEGLRREARLAAAGWEALADGHWAAELAEAVEWTTRDGRRLPGPQPPSEGFIRKLHTEIARADGPRWWEGMAEADARELEEASVVRALRRGAEGVIDFDPKKHPRVAKGRKGGGRFADVLGRLSTDAKAGRATKAVPSKSETYKGYTLEQEPSGEWGIAEDRSRVFKNLEAVKRYIDGPAARMRGVEGRRTPPIPSLDDIGPGDRVTIRTPQGQERSGRAVMRGPGGWVLNMGGAHGTPGIASEQNIVKVRKARTPGPTIPGGRANPPIDDTWEGFVEQMDGKRGEAPHVVGGLRIDPKALAGIREKAAEVGPEAAVDDYLERIGEKWGGPWETIRPHLVGLVGGREGRATPSIGDPASPGRGPSGKLRNFKAMSETKLAGVITDLHAYGQDPEALNAAQIAAAAKGMDDPLAGAPAAPAPSAPTAPGGELTIDHAIGSVLKSHGDDLKDWHLSGPEPVGGEKRWTLEVELKNGQEHKILVSESGEVTLVPPGGGPLPFLSGMVPQPAEKPHAQHTAAAQAAAPAGAENLAPTGETEKPYHMADGTYFKGADGHTYQKLESGPQLMQGKKGPLAAVRIKNVDLGTEKVAPAFALGTYYEILEPGGGGGAPGGAAEPEGDVYELLKKSVGGGGGAPDIKKLAAKVPAGGYAAVEKKPGATDALNEMEKLPIDEYRKLDDKTLQKVYETAEDVNWHTVAGMAWQVLQERQKAGTGKVAAGIADLSLAPLDAGDLDGKKVVITGAIEGMTRKEAAERLASYGAQLQSSVTNQTDILITGKNVGKTKTQAAEKKGVTVVPVSAVLHLLEVAAVDDKAKLEATELALEEATETAEIVRLRARRDALRARLGEAVLTAAVRKKLPASAFALPGGRYPIHDEAHARNALARVAQHGTPEEQKKVRAAVKRRYPHIGQD